MTDLLQKCRDLGIETDITKRWEEGVPHHPRSVEVMEALAELDFYLGGDFFGFKMGGDGTPRTFCALSGSQNPLPSFPNLGQRSPEEG